MSSEQHRWVVDSIEEHMASVEVDGDKTITVPIAALPAGTAQGHVLRVRHERSSDGQRSTSTIEIDADATKQALSDSAAQVEQGRRQSKANDKGGDITL